ncbi:lipoprotein [Alteraurantiacibacter buctensis]|uniref:Lipoprotein n=1 Tax=Alteraurantiacibacter buctensis TaxID=1503981 RepID=A0A844YPP0_9SPHN|nr:lipoprotein [Alteraurantiacibacter buctensis]MXO70345.1 lipoprotein [Alteraurantiacibacter buctensis]
MKKIIAVAVLALGLAACSSEEAPAEDSAMESAAPVDSAASAVDSAASAVDSAASATDSAASAVESAAASE